MFLSGLEVKCTLYTFHTLRKIKPLLLLFIIVIIIVHYLERVHPMKGHSD